MSSIPEHAQLLRLAYCMQRMGQQVEAEAVTGALGAAEGARLQREVKEMDETARSY